MSASKAPFGFRIFTEIPRPAPALLKRFAALDPGLVSDAMYGAGAMASAIKPIASHWTILGPAVTVRLPIGDSLLVAKALEIAKEGDILVIDAHGMPDNAVWGDNRSLGCKQLKLGGAVIDGACRDAGGLRELDFPVFSRFVTCRASSKNNPGEINVAVACGGVVVMPGDIIMGDDSGIVAIPPAYAEEILASAEKKAASQEKLCEAIRAGRVVPASFQKELESMGYK